MKALQNNLLILPKEEETKTAGGILVAKSTVEKPVEGEVYLKGPDVQNPYLVKGSRVLFKKYAPDEVKVNNITYLVIREGDIMLILDKEEVEGVGFGMASDIEMHKDDTIQPFTEEGKVNEEWSKRYSQRDLEEASKITGNKI